MILLKPSSEIINTSHDNMNSFIESCGRVCYKSEKISTPEESSKFIRKLINNEHESVLEHGVVTVKIICDRGVSHELVRHRIASYSQESTRYCNYTKKGMEFIIPEWINIEPGNYSYDNPALYMNENELRWLSAMAFAENFYNELIANGWTPQQARTVLPNSLKTEIIITANLREWRSIFNLRCANAAHPQMREVMIPLLGKFYDRFPDFFFDIYNRFWGDATNGQSKC